jgi:hypothetical protein
MKELHNNIFSNTTCISKETMLRYINKQLDKDELYEVEKHMLDCELCTDAYEGMKFAQNSSILFAIDNEIDQRVGEGNSKAPIMRNLMVAASILIIIFGAYFTYDNFNTTINSNNGLAINGVGKTIEEKTQEGEVEQNNQGELSNAEEPVLVDNEGVVSDENLEYRAVIDVPEAITEEQLMDFSDAVSYDMEDIVEEDEEITITASMSAERVNKTEGEKEKSSEVFNDRNTIDEAKRREDDFGSVLEPEKITTSNPAAGFSYNSPKTDNTVGALKKEAKKDINKTRSKNNKKGQFKSSAQEPAYYNESPVEEVAEDRDRKQRKTVIIDTYKVVDYTIEYQESFDLKNVNIIDTKSIPADFEGKTDKDNAEKELDEITVEITYKATLEKAIKFYKDGKYLLAIEQFDIILKEHPNEVNGLFYGGLSNYHLKRYSKAETKLDSVLKNKEIEFNEEANWYKSLTLIELKNEAKAKEIFEKIIKSNGFYKIQAEEKLKELK